MMAAVKMRHVVLPLLLGAFVFVCLPPVSDAWFWEAVFRSIFVDPFTEQNKKVWDVRAFSRGMHEGMLAEEQARRDAYAERQRKIAAGEIILISAEQARKNWIAWHEENRKKVSAWGFKESVTRVNNLQIFRTRYRTRVLKDRPALQCQKSGNLVYPVKNCNYGDILNQTIADTLTAQTEDSEAPGFGEVLKCPVSYSRCYFVDPKPVRSWLEAENSCRAARSRLASVYSAKLQNKLNDFVLGKLNQEVVRVWTAGKLKHLEMQSQYGSHSQSPSKTDKWINWLKLGKYSREKIARKGSTIPEFLLSPAYEKGDGPGQWIVNHPRAFDKDQFGPEDPDDYFVYMITSSKPSEFGFANTPMSVPEQDKHDFYPLCEYDVYSELNDYDFIDYRYYQEKPYYFSYVPKDPYNM